MLTEAGYWFFILFFFGLMTIGLKFALWIAEDIEEELSY